MSTKPKIDDAMVDRAARLLGHGSPHNREDVRRALESALEDDIPVSDKMRIAGQNKLSDLYSEYESLENMPQGRVVDIYRAMRRVEMEESKSQFHRRSNDPKFGRADWVIRQHRRKGDPR